jgi:hypothetical protein
LLDKPILSHLSGGSSSTDLCGQRLLGCRQILQRLDVPGFAG